ncbi:hypothetical protein BDBG_05175 [Blastomyces gilchristii SLH14081]|uniref:Uncharacterized protein n=1 Tax=Blastomyces gilchristii (strain SLH14081) TaxID=559298 RepID=A0A179UNG8_BLAGS|nr:uncharacterized protein BDBG_05175 [Blastomyces gilchristii SLH14081]OAT09383.1 hypothetical protein BDBG_05175 [Blastomyces gilchristii SLH14081]
MSQPFDMQMKYRILLCLPNLEAYAPKLLKFALNFLTPKLSEPRLMDENLFRPFRYSYGTWKHGAVALHHELLEISRSWKRCIPLPTPKELADLEKEYKLFVAAQDLKRDLSPCSMTCMCNRTCPEEIMMLSTQYMELIQEVGELEFTIT